ncbi:UDP-glucuronosyltransferase 1-7 [Armadillidium nasatum]|uniref:UDP-glucuronosyltransferase 1-7 n=1 Tax=Armadillidium nasatum TaxID=96803 RepID=A0A5N5T7I5_9CRUS|nr:UDP-glucuronosyltransferase 1-7 [Armadillidium nasatum]
MWEQGLNLGLFPIEGFITVSAYCKELLSSDGLIHQLKKQNFKVAVVDLVFNECGLALAHKLGLPIVGFWGFNFASGPAFYSAAFNPPSALPQTFSSFGNSMTFMERVWNTLYFLGIYSLMETQFIVTNNVIQQYVKDCPHPSQLISNASGMLINSHPAIDYPRLLPPSYLEVAGMHQRDIKPLPEVIVKAKGLPSYLPSNVKIYSFFPQADILVFLDQKDNLRRLEELGVARGLDKEADANEIEFVLKEVLSNSSYKENMKILSRNVKAFGSPLQKAVWLLEHIIETKGAPHLKLASRDLHLLQYLCIDIIAFFLLIIAIFLTAIFKIIVKVRRTFVEAEISTKVKLN